MFEFTISFIMIRVHDRFDMIRKLVQMRGCASYNVERARVGTQKLYICILCGLRLEKMHLRPQNSIVMCSLSEKQHFSSWSGHSFKNLFPFSAMSFSKNWHSSKFWKKLENFKLKSEATAHPIFLDKIKLELH